ncbi:Cullin family-domain-containing protein [Collybia nuda]|uniref:Cullin family-domain-containing protein n=1 Tax=Collybia nuda TaxID=64659 RepID=A0A9P5Y304_9AGAR|nr:Cullin family-domain-containing protein [Collybia nuda]
MANVFTLLSLPKTSNAFTTIRLTATDTLDYGSRRTANTSGPIKIEIRGDEVKETHDNDPHALVRRCIEIVLTRDSPDILPTTYEGIYSACRSIVTVSNKGEGLYGTLKMELEKAVNRLAKGLTEFAKEGMNWVVEFLRVCQWFEKQMDLLQSLVTYVDQVYVVKNLNTPSIRTLGYSLFTDRIFENRKIAENLRGGILEWITWERKFGRPGNAFREQVPALISQLNLYKQYSPFETYYVETTTLFYKTESEEQAQRLKNDPKGFFKHAHQRIEEETQLSKAVLPVGSWGLVREATENALWSGRLEWLASETVGPYMISRDIPTLTTMYSLFSRVDGTKVLCSSFRKHIQETVQNIVQDVDHDDTMVQRLLDFKAHADNTISHAFVDEKASDGGGGGKGGASSSITIRQPNNDFIYALGDAFTVGFKARRNKPAEMIAKYLDKAMRKGQGTTSDLQFEALLDSVLALYRFTDDKDVFRTFYHRALAKRLLLQKSASDDFEAAMLKKLKEKYDPEFGMGEDMFKDLALSREAMRDYHSRLDSQSAGLKLTVMVLQRSAWPFGAPETEVHLPPSMDAELREFAAYYKQRHSGHELKWDHALGSVTMKGRFKPGSKELSVSLFQALVLLLFNTSTELSYLEIEEQTKIEDAELRRTLQSLACGKKKVLRKMPPGRDVADNDMFRFNENFEDPREKVHINSIQAKVSLEESRRTNISIEGDRKHYLDAAIVRIMKSRKEMTYEQLKAATIDAVKSHFVPQVDAIKKRIDSLVETDYLERSKEDKTKFLYVA